VFVWALFSVGATILQRILAGLLFPSPMMELVSLRASAALLALAGDPAQARLPPFLPLAYFIPIGHWCGGRGGAFRMGIDHGVYCVGCGWALMLLLFAGRLMNLYVIGPLTMLLTIEKMVWAGELSSRLTGALLVALAVWISG
jgi:predicted metal-binding membrane protein